MIKLVQTLLIEMVEIDFILFENGKHFQLISILLGKIRKVNTKN
jgi:hypothetical protein